MKKKFIKKLLLGGVITSLSLCCCFLKFNKNIYASTINYDSNNFLTDEFISYFNFKSYNNIESLNDLKGTMWLCNYDSTFESFTNDFNTYTLSYISPLNAVEENNYLLAPFILQNPIYEYVMTYKLYSYNTQCYSLGTSNTLEFVENFANDDYLQKFIASDIITTTYSSQERKFIYTNSSIRSSEVILACNTIPNYFNQFEFNTTNIFDLYLSTSFKLQAPSTTYWYNLYLYKQASPFILCFPNSDYILEYSTSDENVSDDGFLELFKTHFTQINFENLSIRLNSISKDIEFDKGYDDGYEMGYNQGVHDASDSSYRLPFLTGILNAVGDILALEVFPNVRLGYFILIPLALGVTGMIFWFWRKD